MFLKVDGINGILYHDIDGNIIMKLEAIYYFLSIDRNDNLEFLELNYDALVGVEEDMERGEIISTLDKFSLRQKVLDEIDKEEEVAEELDDEIPHKTYFKFYPEEKNYYVEKKVAMGAEDDVVKFMRCGDAVEYLNRTMDVAALYDTFVVDLTGKILFTLEADQKSSYRVTFNTDSTVELNVVGTKISTYTFHMVDGCIISKILEVEKMLSL